MTGRQRLEAWATGHPLELAIFRITTAVVVLGSVDVWEAHRWVHSAVAPPSGWGLVSAWFPPTEFAALAVTGVVAAAAGLTLVGLFTRPAAIVATCALAWLLAVPQHSGQVLHTHHLVWFFALIAAGPSGDALSLDAWRRRRVAQPSIAHGLPVRVAWLTVGVLFFFPGAWKLLAGPAWLDALPGLVAWKRFQLGLDGVGPVSPGALRWGGAAAVLLELSLGGLLVFRRTRGLALALALAFHLGVQAVMGIAFSSLWACYVGLGDWARWLGRAEPAAAPDWRPARASLGVGGLLLLSMVATGLLGREDTWPVACYPTFRFPAPAVVSWVELPADDEGPALTLEVLRGPGGQRWWGLSARVAANPTAEAVAQLHRQWRGPGASPPSRFVVATWRPGSGAPVARQVVPLAHGP